MPLPKKPSQTLFFALCIALLLRSFPLFSQNDSLQEKSYETLATLHEQNLFSNPGKAEIYAVKSYETAKKEEDPQKMATALYNIATSNYYLGKFEDALPFTTQSLTISKSIKDNALLFKNYNLRGNIYSDLKKEFVALDEYLLAKNYAEKTDDPIQVITVSVNIAFLKKLHQDHQEALEILKENLQLIEKIPNTHPKKQLFERILLMNIADTYLRIKKPSEAAVYNDRALKSCENDEVNIVCTSILMNEGIIQYQHKNFDSAIEISKQVHDAFTTLKNQSQLITPAYYLGKCFFEKKQYQKAIENLENAIQISVDENVSFLDQKEVHKLLYLSYTEIGNTEKAKENFTRYSELDSENDSINMQLNNKIHKKYDIVPLQEEIDSLGTYTNYLYSASIILLLVLIGLFIWFKKRQRQNKSLFQELLLQIEALEKAKARTVSETTSKESSNPITDENVVQILKALESFEEKELYLRQDCTLGYVAKKVKTNTSYLSNVINTYKEKSFKSYLTELRINAALIQLKNNDKLRSYTIKAIAEEFGFKRSETFSRAFKAQTGMYPSYYIKSLQNQQDT